MRVAYFASLALFFFLTGCGTRTGLRAPDGEPGADGEPGIDDGGLPSDASSCEPPDQIQVSHQCPPLGYLPYTARHLPSEDYRCDGNADCTLVEDVPPSPGCPNKCVCACFCGAAYQIGCTRIFCGDMPNVCASYP